MLHVLSIPKKRRRRKKQLHDAAYSKQKVWQKVCFPFTCTLWVDGSLTDTATVVWLLHVLVKRTCISVNFMTETKSNSILFWICRIAGVYVSTWWQSLSSFFIIMDGLCDIPKNLPNKSHINHTLKTILKIIFHR